MIGNSALATVKTHWTRRNFASILIVGWGSKRHSLGEIHLNLYITVLLGTLFSYDPVATEQFLTNVSV
jgi:hypothetical protein